MKILLVITRAEIGGAQTFVLTVARGLKKAGAEVSVAAGDGDYLPHELAKQSIPFFRLSSLKRNKNPFSIFFYVKELKLLIDKEGFDVIHFNSTNTLPGVFSARSAKKKLMTVFTVHGLSVLDSGYKASFILKYIFKGYFKFFFSFIKKIVFVSQSDLTEAERQNITKRENVIYNGLEISADYFLNSDIARTELEKISGKNLSRNFLIGSIGRLAEQKNYNFLINNWSEIKKIKPEAKLVIIGEGPERERYEKLIKENGSSEDIFLIGEKSGASKLLKGFDLFLLPSIYEGLSISLIEALFSGIPILSSDVGGNSEIIGKDNCFNLNDNDFLNKLRKGATISNNFSLFTADEMIKKYKDIYEI
jgi:glycosyltransferase involved in cell wall biosynthesis